MTQSNKRRFMFEVELELDPVEGTPPPTSDDAQAAMAAALVMFAMTDEEDPLPFKISVTVRSFRTADD